MEDFEHNGVYFKTNLSYPSSYKASDTPCRIRITPRDPKTGKAITKRQLRGSDSDKPAETAIFGRDIEDIRKNLFPPVADGIIAQMHLAGFFDSGQASTAPAVDLGELARTYRDAFFAFSQRERNWAPLTVKDYGYQFDIMMQSSHIAAERIHPTQESQLTKHTVFSSQSLLFSSFTKGLSVYFGKHPLAFWAAALWGMPIALVCLFGATAFFLNIALNELNFSFF